MANRRCLQTLTRIYSQYLPSSTQFLHPIKTLNPQCSSPKPPIFQSRFHHISVDTSPILSTQFGFCRYFSVERDDDDDDDVDVEDTEGSDEEEEGCGGGGKEEDAAAIGYKVIGQLQPFDRAFKPYEPVFAVIQIGSHQFKVSNGDCIYTERLKFCDVNDKIILNRVLMLGSKTQTMIGRPVLPDAAVHAVVEEHALDAKVIIFKKKRRKNYRRKNGHRQELTKLRITKVEGIEKPKIPVVEQPAAQVEKLAVAA